MPAAEELAASEDAASVVLMRGMLAVSVGWASALEKTVETSLSVVPEALVSVAEGSLSMTGVVIVAVSVGVVVISLLVDVWCALLYRPALAVPAARARPAMI
jgi:hypothetical protein